jgi:PAS domain S-box-containing protein
MNLSPHDNTHNLFTDKIDKVPHGESDKSQSIINILNGHEEFTLNVFGSIISSNLEAVNISGYEEWEVINKNFSIFYTTEDLQNNQFEKDLKQAEENSRCIISGWKLKKRNSKFYAKIKIEAIRNPLGTLTGYKVLLKDSTHKVISNQRLKRFKSEYLNLYQNSFIGIFKFRLLDLRVLLFNEKAYSIVGRRFEKETAFNELFVNTHEFELFIAALNKDQRVVGFELQLNTSSYEEKWVSIDCKYFPEEGFVEGIIFDVSEKKRQEHHLQHISNELDAFIYHASHDLRAPLSTVLGLVNLIRLDKPIAPVSQYVDMIGERINHLDSLLKDLAVIAYNNYADVKQELISFEEEVATVLRDFSANLLVKVVINVEQECSFYNDSLRIRTILRNLISNAIKFYNRSVDCPFVSIEIRTTPEHAVIEIKDNGIGMDDSDLIQIFHLFHRANSILSGPGLGLHTVKCMVNKIGGKIDVNSKKGVGSEFTIQLSNIHKLQKA